MFHEFYDTPTKRKPEYRFYSFVAGLYLSPLQRGLQTGHAISEMHSDLLKLEVDPGNSWSDVPGKFPEREAYDEWAKQGKTIIILDAATSGGVIRAYNKLAELCVKFDLPVSIFREDEESLGGAATATGIIVPDMYFNVRKYLDVNDTNFLGETWKEIKAFITKEKLPSPVKEIWRYDHRNEAGEVIATIDYQEGSPEFQLCEFLKSYNKAQS